MKLRHLLFGCGLSVLSACGNSSVSFVPAAGHRLYTVSHKDLLEVNGEGLVLSDSSESAALRPGDIVSRQDDSGYLGRVIDVRQDKNGRKVRLDPIGISDAFEAADVEDEIQFTSDPQPRLLPPFSFSFQTQIGEQEYFYTLTSRNGKFTGECDSPWQCKRFVWEFPGLMLEVFDRKAHQSVLRLNADKLVVKKEVSVDFLLDQKLHQVNRFRLVKNEKTYHAFENLSIMVAKRFPVASFGFPLFDHPALASVAVGPMVVTLGVRLKLGVYSLVESALRAKLKASLSHASESRFGAGYDREEGWHIVDEKTSKPHFQYQGMEWHSLPATFIGGAFVDAASSVNLFGAAGPEFFMKAIPLEAAFSAHDDRLKGSLSLRVKGGARFMVKGLKMPVFEFAALDSKKPYCQFDIRLSDLFALPKDAVPSCSFLR